MTDATTQARELIRIVHNDARLPSCVRRDAAKLTRLATYNPDLALERLNDLHKATAPYLSLGTLTTDYARFISIEVFWRFNIAPAVKSNFMSPEDYRRFIETDPNPATRLARDLGPDKIAPATHSWLVPVHRVAGLTGALTKARLNFDQQPPYVMMVFSVAKMKDADMQVREPLGIDAIPSRLIQWRSGNVPDERIDHELQRRALTRIEWRP